MRDCRTENVRDVQRAGRQTRLLCLLYSVPYIYIVLRLRCYSVGFYILSGNNAICSLLNCLDKPRNIVGTTLYSVDSKNGSFMVCVLLVCSKLQWTRRTSHHITSVTHYISI